MSDMLRKEIFCDAILQAGQTEMKLHKLVLLCASPFLAAHSNDITEKMLTITLDSHIEVGASALKDFISYLYFGSLHLTSENLEPIEAVAKLLKVESVIDFCSQFRQMFCIPISEVNAVNHVDETTETHNSSKSFGIKLSQVVRRPISLPRKDGTVYDELSNKEAMEPVDDLEDNNDVITVNSCTPEPVEDELCSALPVQMIEEATADLTEPPELEHEDVENDRLPLTGGGGTCTYCGKTYGTRATLRRHERMHTTEMQCDICHAAFQQKSRLREHMEKHKTEQPFECNICYKKFRSREWMMKHIRFYHEGKTLYHCKVCDKRFIQKSKFDNHYASKHYKVTLYVCRKCKKNFSNGPALNTHQIECLGHTHAEEESGSDEENLEMYVCKTCSMSFVSKKNMDQHIASKHPEKRHKCSMCEKTYGTVAGLARHRKQIHGNSN
ncbi:hypothetical protein ScPMuIL_015109 [Solemya velum]